MQDQPTGIRRQADLVTALARRIEMEAADGRNPLADLRENPICSVTVDRDVPCLSIEWRGYATSVQFRYVHENAILLLRSHGLSKVLSDNASLRAIVAEDQAWVVEDWLPRAAAAGYRAGAILRAQAYFADRALESVIKAADGTVNLRSFDDRAEAREWLRRQPQ